MSKQKIFISIIISFLTVGLIMSPSYASDTTTTEVGAQVEQIIQIHRPSNTKNSLDPNDNTITTELDATGTSTYEGGDTVVVNIDPTASTDRTYGTLYPVDFLAIKSNVTFDLTVKADPDFHTDVDSNNGYDLRYSSSVNSDPAKPVSDWEVAGRGLGTDAFTSSGDFQNALTGDKALSATTQKTILNGVPAGTYTANDEGLDIQFTFNKTQPDNMPAGFYKAKLIWTVKASS